MINFMLSSAFKLQQLIEYNNQPEKYPAYQEEDPFTTMSSGMS